MSEQGSPEDDPSAEWIYDREADMWISPRQQIAIEGVTYRRMVTVRSVQRKNAEQSEETSEDPVPQGEDGGDQ